MKKEFKAPIIETKLLSVQEDVMDSVLSVSTETATFGTTFSDNATSEDYKQWKGFKK